MENIYIIFLTACLLLSITVDVKWAEAGFRACSLGMGCFTILMLISTILYALNVDSMGNFALIFIFVWFLSYSLPLMLNIGKVRTGDFIKGVVYSIFMSPTYVNIFTIFAISNIHDVSWGSRPVVNNPLSRSAEQKKEENYKNYRSNFLVFWIL